MSFIDYKIMADGHGDYEKNKMMHTRQISWQIYASNPPQNPSPTIDAWWPINKESKTKSRRVSKKRILDAVKKLNEHLKGSNE